MRGYRHGHGRSCRPPKPWIGFPVGNCPKSEVAKIAYDLARRVSISMTEAVGLVKNAKSDLEMKAVASGRKTWGRRGWTIGELAGTADAAYHEVSRKRDLL